MVKTIIFENMRKNLLYLLLLPFAFAACSSECKQPSGAIAHRQVQYAPFDEISVSGPLKLLLRQDSAYQVGTNADSVAVELVKVELSGQKLEISLKPGLYCGTDTITVTASIGDLKKMNIKGGSSVATIGKINVNNLEIKTADSTFLQLNLNAGKLLTDLNGATDMQISGQTGTHELKSKGNLNLQAFELITGIYNLDLEGMAKARINVLNTLKIKTSGSSEVYYKGNPGKVDEKKSGTSKLEKVI